MGTAQAPHRGSGAEQHGGELGFTLMELLIVIVVLGILSGIVVFALGAVTAQSAVAACNSDAATVETAVSAYNAMTGGTPTVTPTLLTSGSYLHSMPNSPYYSITINSSGTVMIAAPQSATAVSYGTANACSNAGSGGSGTTTTIAPTTTTTTAVPTTTSTTLPPTTTTTTAPPPTTTTTTTPVSNGVTASPSVNSYGGYGGQDILTLSNSKSITSLTITINVAQTTGVTANGGYTSFPGGAGTQTFSTGNGYITSTYVLNSGQTIPAGYSNGQVAAQYAGTGSSRVTTGDTWSVVSTSGGVTSILNGHF
jgi:prepilin-type N-terminal cleavage/methylation domain-containing protein